MFKFRSLRGLCCFAHFVLLVAFFTQTTRAEPPSSGDHPPSSGHQAQLDRIRVFPATVVLNSPRDTCRFAVTGLYADGHVRDLTRLAEFSSTDEQTVRLEGATALPVGNGVAEIVVRFAGLEHRASMQVMGQDEPDPVSFHYEVESVLTKQSCNSGACHGSPAGKGGFRLSMLAYAPELDAETVVQEEHGRRVNVLEPESSLLLLKPTMSLTHGGGQRLRTDDPVYDILKTWIAEGCRIDSSDHPACESIEVFPRSGRLLMRPDWQQQLIGRANFSDATTRQINGVATFSSSDESVATVSADGLVTGHRRGATAIMVRYLDRMTTCYLTFVEEVQDFVWTEPPADHYIDRLVNQKLQQLRYLPSELCSDGDFLRRVCLDVTGTLPTKDQVEAFLQDPSPQKRERLIDTLLDRPEYTRFWTLKWADLLRINRENLTDAGVHKYYAWLIRVVQQNVPYDQFVRQLLTAQGSTLVNPPASYFRAASDTHDCIETTAQLFLGIRIRCAQCHNHPFERWTQDNYYGMAAFFNRVQRKESQREDELIIWVAPGGEVTQPRTGQTMAPWLPLVGEVSQAEEGDRRELLIDWMTDPENPFFAKVAVNRIWSHVMGRGIVEPIDDFRATNPPSHPELLDALARDFVEHGFDQRHILRIILNSQTYQRSVATNQFNREDQKQKYFSHAGVRLLGAEQLLDAIGHVTGVPANFPGLPAGTRAIELPAPDVDNEFLRVFGQPVRQSVCACERTTDVSVSQVLELFNGPVVLEKLKHPDNRFRKMIAAGRSDEEIATQLYLTALCRYPTNDELAAVGAHVAAAEQRDRAWEDICWSLLATKEFLFQH